MSCGDPICSTCGNYQHACCCGTVLVNIGQGAFRVTSSLGTVPPSSDNTQSDLDQRLAELEVRIAKLEKMVV